MRDILRGSSGRLVILTVRDDIAFLNGREYVSEYTLSDWVKTAHSVGADANVMIGLEDYLPQSHRLAWKTRIISQTADARTIERSIPTPFGRLSMEMMELRGDKPARRRMFLEKESDYQGAISYLRELRTCGDDIVAHLSGMRKEVGERGLLTIFISQPFEMQFFILHEQMVYHYIDWPETYGRAMREVEETSFFVIECAARAGADMMMFGSVGTELLSPAMIEEHNLRPAYRYAARCKELGLFSLMHSCGRTKTFLDRGWFDGFVPTIFESFTSAPLGDIDSPREAADKLHPDTFFKGGLRLELLRNGTPEQVREATVRAYDEFGHRRFILAGTCALLAGTPRENLLAVTDAAAEWETAQRTGLDRS